MSQTPQPSLSRIGALFRTLLSRFLLGLLMLVCFIPAVFFLFIMPARYRYDNKAYYWFCHFFYRAVLKISFFPITYIGKDNIPLHEPVIIAANHQSSLDIPIVGALMGTFPHIWLATITLMSSPILRFIVPRATVLIDMSSPLTGMKSLIQAIQMINGKNRHVIIFPEGGRYTDGKIHDFYAGFVILAKKTGRPVVPIRIIGLNNVYPPKVFIMNRYPVTVIIGKPMQLQEGETDESFKNRVYQWFVEQKED
jgi:1-acyl-sn-glycerol-3-phosphate acyltransferase